MQPIFRALFKLELLLMTPKLSTRTTVHFARMACCKVAYLVVQGRFNFMGLLKHGVRRVSVLRCEMLLLHFYLAYSALASPQPPSSPFADFLYTYNNSSFIVQGRNLYEPNSDSCSNPLWHNLNMVSMPAVSCVLPTAIQFKDNATSKSVYSFSTKFIALMSPGKYAIGTVQRGYNGERNALEGFTFAILPTSNHSGAGNGGYLGLLNATSNGNNQSHTVAIEFDFVQNPEFSDPANGFHIGLDINSMNSTSSTYLEYPAGSDQSDRFLHVWIDYDDSSQMLNVTALDISDNPTCPVSEAERTGLGSTTNTSGYYRSSFSQRVDLSSVLNEYMYVGFTSSQSTSPEYDYIDMSWSIYAWSFRITSNSTSPAPPSASLPCLFYSLEGRSFVEKHSFAIRLTKILVMLSAVSAIYAIVYRYYSQWVERRGWRFNIDADDLGAGDPHQFTYKELAIATKNFDAKQALGRGGFGSVYKGFLPGNKQDVAVKRVSPDSKQGEREFLAEVVIIGKLRHRNLVRLQGWCHEKGELLLVYDYMPQGSLDKLLFVKHVDIAVEIPSGADQEQELVSFDNNNNMVAKFPWVKRFTVIVDVAKALVYLHTECEERIIHRDVKAANVMLDAKFNARLGDFGLARSYNHSLLNPESTNVAGTFGYLAPELFHTGKQTEQTDVYSFGAFLLEVACGRKPIYHEDDDVVLLVDHVWKMWGKLQILDVVDPQLAGMYDDGETTKVLCLGLLCSHPSPAMRPSMRQVLLILNGDINLPLVPLLKPRIGDIHRTLSQDLSRSTTLDSSYTA